MSEKLGEGAAAVQSGRSNPVRRVFVSTVPFCVYDPRPLAWLAEAGVEVVVNPLGRRLAAPELAEFLRDADALIAGTEPITAQVIAQAPQLRLIARVGVGLDNVDLLAARRAGVEVAYTPEAPAPAVAELTVGLMLDLLRHIGRADRAMRGGRWERRMGRRLSDCTVGVIGAGRIGRRLIAHLAGGFPGVRLLAHDLAPDETLTQTHGVQWVSRETLCRESDVITLHVPLTPTSRHLIAAPELALMKGDAMLINTARGGIVDEAALESALDAGRLAGAAVDTFEHEPYDGPLARLENCLVTCHMGSMTRDCRTRMEVEATQEVLRLVRGEALLNPVPEAEYSLASTALLDTVG